MAGTNSLCKCSRYCCIVGKEGVVARERPSPQGEASQVKSNRLSPVQRTRPPSSVRLPHPAPPNTFLGAWDIQQSWVRPWALSPTRSANRAQNYYVHCRSCGHVYTKSYSHSKQRSQCARCIRSSWLRRNPSREHMPSGRFSASQGLSCFRGTMASFRSSLTSSRSLPEAVAPFS